MQRLTDQVAVVTGGARGVGHGIASVLAAEGARVVIADVDGAHADEAAAALRARDLDVLAVATDVTDRASVDALTALVIAEHGRIDILAANAGVYPMADLATIDDAVWDRVMNINVSGAGATGFTVNAVGKANTPAAGLEVHFAYDRVSPSIWTEK